jgi:hypothetical protein
MLKQTVITAATFSLLVLLTGCGGTDESPTFPTSATTIEGDAGVTDAPTPVESVAAQPTTSIVSCKIDNGLPVAEVKVSNTTDMAAEFSVEVQFENGDTVLGSGLEFTRKLQPGQNQTIRMGNMQGDAEAVDTCKVIDASATE